MKTTETPIGFMKNLIGEYNICRAGFLAELRILDGLIVMLEENPDYISQYEKGINYILELRKARKASIERVSKEIELLTQEIEIESHTPKNIKMIARLHGLLGHL